MAEAGRIAKAFIAAVAAVGSAIAAGSWSTGAVTEVDNTTLLANGCGAPWIDVYLEVTIAPSAETTVLIEQDNYRVTGAASGVYEPSLTGKVPAALGEYYLGFVQVPDFAKFRWQPVDYSCDGVLRLVPKRYASS